MASRYYIVRDGVKVYRKSVAEIKALAQKLANDLGRKVPVHMEPGTVSRAAGAKASRLGNIDGGGVYSRNPKSRSKLTGSRGFYVEWSYGSGTPKNRVKYANKGIATIRANGLKRDGAKGVRVYSA